MNNRAVLQAPGLVRNLDKLTRWGISEHSAGDPRSDPDRNGVFKSDERLSGQRKPMGLEKDTRRSEYVWYRRIRW
jgi:hypothetical protein